MQRLDQRYRQRRANGPERWNLPELGGDGMFPTLRQQFSPRLLSQMLQHVQLLVESLGPPAPARLPELAQPLGAMTGVVDVPSNTGHRPAAIQSPSGDSHDSRQIFDEGQVAPGQLAQHAHARLAMVDRLEIIEA